MDRSIAAAELHGTPCQDIFDQGGAFRLWHNEDGTDVSRARYSDRSNDQSPAARSPEWARFLLGDVAPAAVMDALGKPILAKLIGSFGSLRTERLQMILIGPRGQYLCDCEIANGAGQCITSRFRPMIEHALARGAAAIVLVRNHPSGNCYPSEADIVFTRRFATLCVPLDLYLSDHLIVARNSVFSMHRAGLL